MRNLKHYIRSPKFYELLIKAKIKGDTDLDLNNFYKKIKMCLNAVTRLREDLLTTYQYIKRHSEFDEYFSQIVINFSIIGMLIPTLTLDTQFWLN